MSVWLLHLSFLLFLTLIKRPSWDGGGNVIVIIGYEWQDQRKSNSSHTHRVTPELEMGFIIYLIYT